MQHHKAPLLVSRRWVSASCSAPAPSGHKGPVPRVSAGDTIRPVIEHLAGSRQKPGLFAERQKFTHSYRQQPQWADQEMHLTVCTGPCMPDGEIASVSRECIPWAPRAFCSFRPGSITSGGSPGAPCSRWRESVL